MARFYPENPFFRHDPLYEMKEVIRTWMSGYNAMFFSYCATQILSIWMSTYSTGMHTFEILLRINQKGYEKITTWGFCELFP